MAELTHGGDVYSLAEECAGPILDFSANINPLGLPEGVRRAAEASLADCARYPDPLCRGLRKALGERLGLGPELILCGNGAADLIFRMALALRPRRGLIPAPTFSEYARALEAAGCRTETHFLREEDEFRVTGDLLERLEPGLDILCLCSPNNPTGWPVEPALLEEILLRCRENGTAVLLDECFVSFLDEPERYTMVPRLREFPNLVILRAFTKLYAMAGLRLGFCLSADAALLEEMSRRGQPWGVSIPAQAAGMAALGEAEYLRRTRELIPRERAFLREGLEGLGFPVVGSRANYLFFRGADGALARRLRPMGILLRNCGNYPGLGPGWYRAAVRAREENAAFLAALKKVKEGKG